MNKIQQTVKVQILPFKSLSLSPIYNSCTSLYVIIICMYLFTLLIYIFYTCQGDAVLLDGKSYNGTVKNDPCVAQSDSSRCIFIFTAKEALLSMSIYISYVLKLLFCSVVTYKDLNASQVK